MKQSAAPLPSTNGHHSASQRRRHEKTLVRALDVAERWLPRDEALEIAHAITCEMMRYPPERITGALLYMAVSRRVRSHWRSTSQHARIEGAYDEMSSTIPHEWAEPGGSLGIAELHERIARTLDAMPPRMREVFILIREEELSYREAAARLGLAVGTIHTYQRACALNSPGDLPVQRLNARWNALGSENPSRNPT